MILGIIIVLILVFTYKSGYYYGKHDALNSVEKELNNLQDALAEFRTQLYTVEPIEHEPSLYQIKEEQLN